MTIARTLLSCVRWPLPRLLILILAGGFAGLMVDIRVEHVDAVHDHSIAWLPIVYSGLMLVACFWASLVWTPMMRRVLLFLFSIAFVIGGLGFYFHNHGHITRVFRSSLAAWTDPRMEHSDGPPQTAPLAFAGLGVIGILASLKRFSPEALTSDFLPASHAHMAAQWKIGHRRADQGVRVPIAGAEQTSSSQ